MNDKTRIIIPNEYSVGGDSTPMCMAVSSSQQLASLMTQYVIEQRLVWYPLRQLAFLLSREMVSVPNIAFLFYLYSQYNNQNRSVDCATRYLGSALEHNFFYGYVIGASVVCYGNKDDGGLEENKVETPVMTVTVWLKSLYSHQDGGAIKTLYTYRIPLSELLYLMQDAVFSRPEFDGDLLQKSISKSDNPDEEALRYVQEEYLHIRSLIHEFFHRMFHSIVPDNPCVSGVLMESLSDYWNKTMAQIQSGGKDGSGVSISMLDIGELQSRANSVSGGNTEKN